MNREKIRKSYQKYEATTAGRTNKKKKQSAYQKKQVEKLSDFYVRQRLAVAGVRNPTPEMIEEKRLQLKIIRKANELTGKINAC